MIALFDKKNPRSRHTQGKKLHYIIAACVSARSISSEKIPDVSR